MALRALESTRRTSSLDHACGCAALCLADHGTLRLIRWSGSRASGLVGAIELMADPAQKVPFEPAFKVGTRGRAHARLWRDSQAARRCHLLLPAADQERGDRFPVRRGERALDRVGGGSRRRSAAPGGVTDAAPVAPGHPPEGTARRAADAHVAFLTGRARFFRAGAGTFRLWERAPESAAVRPRQLIIPVQLPVTAPDERTITRGDRLVARHSGRTAGAPDGNLRQRAAQGSTVMRYGRTPMLSSCALISGR